MKSVNIAKQEDRRAKRITAALLAPGTIWMLLFLVVPMLMMVYVSFWTQKTFSIEPTLTLKSWITFFSSDTYFNALLTTGRIWLTVLFCTIVIGYPVALFYWLVHQEQDHPDHGSGLVRHSVLDLVPDPRSGLAADARQGRGGQYYTAKNRSDL